MTIKREAHITQLGDLVEVITIAASLALLCDALWCVRDMIVSGVTIGMIMISVGLWTAFLITVLALYRYHKEAAKKILKEKMKIKLKCLKECAKHNIKQKRGIK